MSCHGTLEVGTSTQVGPAVLYGMMNLLQLAPLAPPHASAEFEARSELSSAPHLWTT